ncbi:MAG: hypothetical protein FJ147_13230 [Deltaproteobacteria bacterium]|nr:hypothetical protein [Deltaproteobacteria bacterium]
MQGFHHFAVLLREPGRQFHVAALLSMTDGELDEAQPVDDTSSERIRKTVANRLCTALTKIKKIHPTLWRRLFGALKTGKACSYNPEKPMEWHT